MARARAEPQGRDPRWTADELAERYEDLAAIEPFVDAAGERAAAPAPDDLELVATLEALQIERHGAPARAAPAAPEGAVDVETYAVLPTLDLLAGMAETARLLGRRDDAGEETVPERRARVA